MKRQICLLFVVLFLNIISIHAQSFIHLFSVYNIEYSEPALRIGIGHHLSDDFTISLDADYFLTVNEGNISHTRAIFSSTLAYKIILTDKIFGGMGTGLAYIRQSDQILVRDELIPFADISVGASVFSDMSIIIGYQQLFSMDHIGLLSLGLKIQI